jgi:cyclohexyl-isocyanide hydratase
MSDSTPNKKIEIGFLIFPGLTQLDMSGPYEVLSFLPGARVHLIWKDLKPVEDSHKVLRLSPTTTFDSCPQLDLICVPGGPWATIKRVMDDEEVLNFLKKQAQEAKYITSVCTGSLILAAAGLLNGYKAACHWQFRDRLTAEGITVSNQRVVIDRNRITGGGITAGIDFALVVAQELYGDDTAKSIQLTLEYNPAPLFDIDSLIV